MNPQGEFTERLWDAISPIYNVLLDHPFVTGLTDGSLPFSCFAHYLTQDIIYIKDDAEALAIVADRVDDAEAKEFFKAMAADGIEIEKALHDEYLHHFQLAAVTQKAPAVENYTQFLLSHAKESEPAIAAAALLPCFWVYNKVGNKIRKHAAMNNVYQKWINTYQEEDFEEFTARFIHIVEKMAASVDEKTKDAMTIAFVQSTQLELEFFEESIRR
ncbi:transcriptional regulator [Puteibacter caeruleilacunae]|nr:transcriptional regulator [Puteibacter caeruleilacunae]